MMFKKALTKSGRRILKAIKKISTARLDAKKQEIQRLQQQQQQQQQRAQPQQQQAIWSLPTRLYELDNLSLVSCSLPSLAADVKSIDTFVTYVAADGGLFADDYYVLQHCCCHCNEHEENQRNENLENEMMR